MVDRELTAATRCLVKAEEGERVPCKKNYKSGRPCREKRILTKAIKTRSLKWRGPDGEKKVNILKHKTHRERKSKDLGGPTPPPGITAKKK